MARLKTQIRRHRLQQRIQNRHRANLNKAVTDALTGLYNRHYLDAHLRRLKTHAVEERRFLSFILCDLDKFKAVNDTHGHAVGDAVLRYIATKLSGCVRPQDMVVRYGGEEFLIVLPDTDLAHALRIAERLRCAIATSVIPFSDNQASLQMTASFGVAECAWTEASTDDALRRADDALYRSKHAGRNRVTASRPSGIVLPPPALAAQKQVRR